MPCFHSVIKPCPHGRVLSPKYKAPTAPKIPAIIKSQEKIPPEDTIAAGIKPNRKYENSIFRLMFFSIKILLPKA